MIAIDRSARPWVWETSGERLSVQLTYSALRSEKSQRDSWHSRSCSAVSSVMPLPTGERPIRFTLSSPIGHAAGSHA